jgi:cytochrome c556
MTEYFNSSTVEPMADQIAPSQGLDLQPAQDPLSEGATTFPDTSYEGSTKAQPALWRPTEPQFTKAIAQHYGVSRKSVQQWFQKVKEACPWFTDADLKLPDERYTPLCIDLMGGYRTSGLPFDAWKAQLWEQNPDLVAKYQVSQRSQFPQPNPLTATSDHPDRLRLHLGSSLSLPTTPSIMAPGDETAYLTQIRQRMEQFEVLQQQVIAQMQAQYQQAQSLNAQYQEATSLSDQLLLQEFQLKGVQLGYTALQLKQQAFKATVQAAESGTLAAPGKPSSETAQPQAA